MKARNYKEIEVNIIIVAPLDATEDHIADMLIVGVEEKEWYYRGMIKELKEVEEVIEKGE